MSVKTCLMIGASGRAGSWIRTFTDQFSERVKIVGLVDVNQEVLENQGHKLGLSKNQLFNDHQVAINSVKADFCGISTPPQFHSSAAVLAMNRGMPVISEKPIADTLDSAKLMVKASVETGLPCAIMQNYRYARNKQEVIKIREEGRLGRLQHVFGRYACDYREYLSWGRAWRHDMDFGLLFEGSVHHFDMLRFLSGGDCETLMGFGWNPEWSSFKHYSSGYYLMRMNNGVHACYEGNSSAAGITNCWNSEHYRLEFEDGTVEIAEGNDVKIHRTGQASEVYTAPDISKHGDIHFFDEFLTWLDGGPPSATRITDNIKSFALVIAAMDTTLDGQPKDLSRYLSDLSID